MTDLRKKPLAEYTDRELLTFLELNEEIEMFYLAGICSEILRRMNKRMIRQEHKNLFWEVE